MGDGDYNSDHHSWMLADENPRGSENRSAHQTGLRRPVCSRTYAARPLGLPPGLPETPLGKGRPTIVAAVMLFSAFVVIFKTPRILSDVTLTLIIHARDSKGGSLSGSSEDGTPKCRIEGRETGPTKA